MEENQVKSGTFMRLLKYMFKWYRAYLIVVIICIIVSSLASVIQSMFLQQLIDNVILPGVENGMSSVASKLMQTILLLATVYLCGFLGSFIYTRLMATVGQGTLYHLRIEMFDNMEGLPIKYFDTHAHGTIMSTYTNDTDTIRQLIGNSLPQVLQSALSLLIMLVMMLYYSVWLTLVVLVVFVLMLLITKKFSSLSSRYMLAQQTSLAKTEGFIEEMMNGQKVVKVFNHEQKAKEDFKKLNDQLYEDGEQANRYGNIVGPILNNIGNLMYVLIAFIGGMMVILSTTNLSLSGMGTITIGIIVSFLNMVRQLSQTISQVSMQISTITQGIAGAGRVFDLIDEENEKDDGYVMLVNAKKDEQGNIVETNEHTGLWAWKHWHQAQGTTTFQELAGDIELVNVDFGYNPDKLVLHDITIYAKPGQKIALVGSTGAGKTTITNLINRFYDIPDGKIRYDGINVNKIKKPDLRRSISLVLQDVNLFTGTVMDNIRYGKLDATDEECIQAAKLANADDFIRRLPQGYDTMLTSNGSNLSQGQRQLISIARAAVADPPVMILDEATSSIDTRTEALVQAGMDNLMQGRTVFVIAHRLSTIRNAQAIMVMEHGRIIERGSHNELMEKKGTYYQLYTGAFELE